MANVKESLVSVEVFKNRPSTLPSCDPSFIYPTPEEVRELRSVLGFSQVDLGLLANLSVNEDGCGTVRKWESSRDKKAHKEISYGVWRLMLYAAGLTSIEDDLKAIKCAKTKIFNPS
jgi:DNA-binding transcriptional regulator YiaG